MVCGVNSLMNKCLNMNWLPLTLALNIEKYCYSYLNGLVDLWCLRGRCLPIADYKHKPKYISTMSFCIELDCQFSPLPNSVMLRIAACQSGE